MMRKAGVAVLRWADGERGLRGVAVEVGETAARFVLTS